ncbi:TMEM165/GDT1 family protein [Nocardia stercoris]|uniref:GDT1 family protein n=1 Tax=Nocardia stercoris TaxID=2483361 RepID=A0A3M2LDW3_9NOCA|nr:TMEM165/GDT1 family protein [Nocardia stercoris]RMI34165.1 TMEM165/GDT1 family protein [Nocardia stercoris]
MITTIALSFGALFLAELGDKSQLMALTFALRYRWWIVLSGITLASVLVNLVAVGVGHFLGAALPTEVMAVVTGVTLIGVGLWTLRDLGANEPETEPGPEPRSHTRAFLMVVSAFVLAELGDRTMFATIALAADRPWIAVWLGAAAGMVAAGALAIGVGIAVGKRVPEQLLATGSALLFLYLGAATLLEAAGLGAVAGYALAAGVPAAGAAVLWLRAARRARSVTGGNGSEQVAAAADQGQQRRAQRA